MLWLRDVVVVWWSLDGFEGRDIEVKMGDELLWSFEGLRNL
jgi:hypothetical protein